MLSRVNRDVVSEGDVEGFAVVAAAREGVLSVAGDKASLKRVGVGVFISSLVRSIEV